MPNRIRQLREARGLTLEQVARIAGTSNQQVSKLERGDARLTDDWMRRLAPAFGVEAAELMASSPMASALRSARTDTGPDDAPGQLREATPPDRYELVGDRDLPVYGAAQGGDGDVLTVDVEPIEWVRRPQPLFHVPRGFGLYVVGMSMKPAYQQGDMVLVHPSLPPAPDSDVVLVRQSEDGTRRALIKHLVNWNDQTWRVEQYHPKKRIDLLRQDWPLVYSVVGKYNRR